jgi:DNA repair protein RecN (Recombination protein N)
VPLKTLARTASGGELSRISLAIEVVNSEASHVPTLMFDEVDVGVGGKVAEIVGQKLRELGAHAQVLSVTHLPQVAAQGHGHLLVNKTSDTSQEVTYSEIVPLDEKRRVQELARMLGGMEITERTLAHAHEMLKQAS